MMLPHVEWITRNTAQSLVAVVKFLLGRLMSAAPNLQYVSLKCPRNLWLQREAEDCELPDVVGQDASTWVPHRCLTAAIQLLV